MSLSAMPVLIADAGDLIKALVTIFFLVIPFVWGVLSKLIEKAKEQRQAQPPRPPVRRAQVGGQAGRRGGGVDDEVDEFLRRAVQRQKAQPARPIPDRLAPASEQPVAAQVVRPAELRQTLRQRQMERLQTEEFERRTSELGGRVSHTNEDVEQRIHARFDHAVGALSDEEREASTSRRTQGQQQIRAATIAAEFTPANLAVMFSSPEDIRQAIILSEVLARPEHRWS